MATEFNVDLPPKFAYDDLRTVEENMEDMTEYVAALHSALEQSLRDLFIRTSDVADSPTADNIATLDSDGNVQDSGSALTDFSSINHSHYVDRGNFASWDFEETDLTTDQTWNELDLSSIVPAGAILVLLVVRLLDGAANSYLFFREKGNSNVMNTSRGRTQVANVFYEFDAIVGLDGDRKIEYYGKNLAFTTIDIGVRGWWVNNV